MGVAVSHKASSTNIFRQENHAQVLLVLCTTPKRHDLITSLQYSLNLTQNTYNLVENRRVLQTCFYTKVLLNSQVDCG